MRRMAVILAMCFTPTLAEAGPLESSLRPVPRPTLSIVSDDVATFLPTVVAPGTRPKLRPAPMVSTPRDVVPAGLVVPRPQPRPRGLAARAQDPEKVTTAAVITPPSKSLTKSKKGSVCGDPSIKGEVLAPISARTKGCGVAEPVRVTSVDGVALSPPAIMDCTTAKALKTWVRKGLQPAFSKRTKVVQIKVAAHYICRTRNNKPGEKISEHGKGRAIDISAIVLADGRVLSVSDDWGKTLRRVYKAACGIFGTTLGPGSDGYHEDHMHFDTARYRKGSYCR